MQTATLGIGISFTAGVLSFLSPCVLPLIPSYIGFITGMSLETMQLQRRAVLVNALLFVVGFTVVFLALGATATVVGRALSDQREWIGRVGGLLLIVFGLYLVGVLNLNVFNRERRLHVVNKPLGYVGTIFVGMAFAAGWTPCIGPILGGVLTYTATTADLSRGMLLLLAYSMGLAVPFLLSALMIDRFMTAFARYRGAMNVVTKVSGALLVVVGLLMITGSMTRLSAIMQRWTPEGLLNRL